MLTRAKSASPGIDPSATPFLSAIAKRVIQTNRVLSSSLQIVEARMELNNLVYPGMLIE